MAKRKKSIYINDDLFKKCVEVVEKSNPSLLSVFKSDKRGWESKLVNYVLQKLFDECLERKKKKP